MNFSLDRDLLALEPGVFGEVPFASQQRLKVEDGVLEGTELFSAEADFAAAGVEAGSVVLVGGVAHEVVDRVDGQNLSVSLPRARLSDEPIAGADGAELTVRVRTFEPQAALVHDALLRLLGIEPDGEAADGTVGEDQVISLGVMARLEALGTLERVYSGAAAVTGDNEGIVMKAEAYRRRFREACRGASVLVDVDGDGRADERRHLGLVRLRRV